MENLFISHLNEKDSEHCTTDFGLYLRKKIDPIFKKICNAFTNVNIIREQPKNGNVSDEEYFSQLNMDRIPVSSYPLKENKHNIIVERYPELNKDDSYIFVCNHTCPEDIETVLNVLDRNAYLVLGSIESLKYNPEMYLLWLNGMLPFDILNASERANLPSKMERVLKTNSILIFPEGSHNYHPNKLVNNLFDGAVNLALKTGKKIVVLTLVRDEINNVSYMDASNPIDVPFLDVDVNDYYPGKENSEKYLIKSYSSYIRDKMATAVYHIIARHIDGIKRSDYGNIESEFKQKKIEEAFSGLKWSHDVFDAEYLVKKTEEEKKHEEVTRILSNLRISPSILKKAQLDSRPYILQEMDLQSKNVASYMRDYWISTNKEKTKSKRLAKK